MQYRPLPGPVSAANKGNQIPLDTKRARPEGTRRKPLACEGKFSRRGYILQENVSIGETAFPPRPNEYGTPGPQCPAEEALPHIFCGMPKTPQGPVKRALRLLLACVGRSTSVGRRIS